MSERRLFFALEPPPQVRDQIARIKQLCAVDNRGRAVTEANLHLTLQFLGCIPEEQIAPLTVAAESLAAAPFELSLDRFGHWKEPRVLWMGPQITPVPLLALQLGVENALEKRCAIKPEAKAYRPHVTLMRKLKVVESLPQMEPILWRVEQFSLMESISTVDGVVYKALKQWKLQAV